MKIVVGKNLLKLLFIKVGYLLSLSFILLTLGDGVIAENSKSPVVKQGKELQNSVTDLNSKVVSEQEKDKDSANTSKGKDIVPVSKEKAVSAAEIKTKIETESEKEKMVTKDNLVDIQEKPLVQKQKVVEQAKDPENLEQELGLKQKAPDSSAKIELQSLDTAIKVKEKKEKETSSTKKEGNGKEYKLVISEVVIGEEGGTKNEFVELFNFSKHKIELENFALKKKTKSGRKSNLVSSTKFTGTIEAGEFFLIKNRNHQGGLEADLNFSGASYNLAKDNRIYLEDPEGKLIDAIGWGSCQKDCEKGLMVESLLNGQSLSRKELQKPKKLAAAEFAVSKLKTPGKPNLFAAQEQYPENIVFSEILANPEGVDKNSEWIELKSQHKAPINLAGWVIENGAGKRFKLTDLELKPGALAVVAVKNSSFVIRNSNETLKLINPADKIVAQLAISGSAPSGISYGWTPERGWSWNRKQTPAKQNIANRLPTFKIKRPKKIYKDIYAYFSAVKVIDGDGDRLKFVWDFGDGHRSYLRKTKHRYQQKGKYQVVLTVKDGFELVQKSFKLEVKTFPQRKLRITQLLPNPPGRDQGKELIEIRNLSTKRVNLVDFYLATGNSSDSLRKYKISQDFIIEPGKARFLSNKKGCRFSLLNKSGRVELLYPDGKRADKVKYRKKKIKEGTIFQLQSAGWEWLEDKKPVHQQSDQELVRLEPVISNRRDLEILAQLSYNQELQFCETYLKMQLENWKSFQAKPINSLEKKVLGKRTFSIK